MAGEESRQTGRNGIRKGLESSHSALLQPEDERGVPTALYSWNEQGLFSA
jgi:hypothetical protein